MKRTFRPQPLLGVAMAVAALFWISVLAFLLAYPTVPLKTFASTAFFVILFVGSVFYYVRTAILVDGDGITYRGMVREKRLSFRDIKKVAVLPGLITMYTVHAGRQTFSFSSFFQRHKELVELLRERAAHR
jgi:hypothetical protein